MPVAAPASVAHTATPERDTAFPAQQAAPPPASPGPAASVIPATSMQMLVTLAATDPEADRRRRLAVESDRGLALLERLYDELARGGVSPERLRALAAWVDGFTPPDDPLLAGIAREIELRVRVELAKAEQAA